MMDEQDELKHAKAAMRKLMIERREHLLEVERVHMDEVITEHILAHIAYRCATTIAVYLDFRGEVSTQRLIDQAWHDGKIVVAPRVLRGDAHMEMFRLIPTMQVEFGAWQVPQPVLPSDKENMNDPVMPQLLIVPGVAFTPCGDRLGYGKGYYDRYLSRTNTGVVRIGIAYDLQVVDQLPIHDLDQRMDWIITPTRLIGPLKRRDD